MASEDLRAQTAEALRRIAERSVGALCEQRNAVALAADMLPGEPFVDETGRNFLAERVARLVASEAEAKREVARLKAENAELRADSKAPTWEKFHAATSEKQAVVERIAKWLEERAEQRAQTGPGGVFEFIALQGAAGELMSKFGSDDHG